jgi:hypothetical protein
MCSTGRLSGVARRVGRRVVVDGRVEVAAGGWRSVRCVESRVSVGRVARVSGCLCRIAWVEVRVSRDGGSRESGEG